MNISHYQNQTAEYSLTAQLIIMSTVPRILVWEVRWEGGERVVVKGMQLKLLLSQYTLRPDEQLKS